MKYAWDVKMTIGLAAIVFIILSFVKGQTFLEELIGVISQTISYTFIIRLIFIKWVWKYIPFLEIIHGIPYLEGKWTGTFESTWRPSPDAPCATGSIEVKITQPDIHCIKITQKSGESLSHSYGEVFETLEDGSIFLNFSYKNVPNADVRDRSQINFGSARYQLERDSSYKLSGNYWTDRKSTGKITVLKS
ncbi:MAG: hypothetical protein M9899_09130 [Bdellovibrionaceae bacterium]|nr:hypothetical protein [Pseudobdellovibrionaceae bacterium]